jgi:nicotinate phosphoribosyltransferase
VAAARAALIGGIPATSNLEAGRRHGVTTAGTAAHAFTLVHDDEEAAFRAQVACLGPGTTLLVDTVDIGQGVRNAVAAAGPDLGAVRIDSGDLVTEVRRVRRLLDELGNHRTRILVSGDVDEQVIASLAGEPVDAFGVGTSVVCGSGAPTAGLIYKLVARGDPLVAVAKRSEGKATTGGRKWAWRLLDREGRAVADEVSLDPAPPAAAHRALAQPLVRAGEILAPAPPAEAAAHHARARAELPDQPLTVRTRGGAP